jgi:hypothetical protein
MRTPHIDTDERELNLWRACLRARAEREMVYELSDRFGPLDNELPLDATGLPDALLSLIQRGKDLFSEFEKLQTELDAAWNSAAWLMLHVADVHYGD